VTTTSTSTKRPATSRTTNRRTSPKKATSEKPPKPRRLSVVLRVSRRNGRDGEGFLSPDQQRDVIDAWAERHGVEIRDEWVWDETDSVSGRTTDREGLQGAMRQALSGETDGIIVAKVDRFSRNLTEGLAAVRQLHEAGKVFVAVNDGIDGSNPKNLGAKVLLTVMLLFAEWYLESITAGWQDTQKRRIAMGVAGIPAFGYRRGNGEDAPELHRRLVPDEIQAPVVRRIFAERAAGKSWQAIVDGLNADGIVPPQRAPRRDGQANRDARLWVVGHVSRIVGNRVYVGELSHGENVNPAAHDPLVDLDLWDAANNVRKTSQRRPETVFILAGIVRCASCGGRMVGNVVTKRENGKVWVNRYMRCRHHYRWGTCPAPARVRADDLEAVVVEVFRAGLPKRVKRIEWVEASDVLKVANEEVTAAREELRRYLSSPLADRRAALDPEAYEQGEADRLDAIEEALRAVEVARSAAGVVGVPKDLLERWDTLDGEAQRGYLANAFGGIAVAPVQGRQRVPVAERIRMWEHGEADAPTNLPGFDGGDEIVAIPMD
jgi:DNA invertase Pin-like site-specific DNA recombinase